MRVDFVWGDDHEHDGRGWRPAVQPNFNVGLGSSVAHDALEHFDLRDGSVEAECLAFGAMLYGRGLSGWFFYHRPFNPGLDFQLGSGISSELRNAFWAGESSLGAPAGDRGLQPLEDEGEDELEPIVERAVADLKEELLNDLEEGENEGAVNVYLESVKQNFPRWLRLGHTRCERRFRAGSCRVSGLYDDLTRRVDELGDHWVDDTKLIVLVRPETLELDLQIKEPTHGY